MRMTTVGAGSAREQVCRRGFAAEGRSYNSGHAIRQLSGEGGFVQLPQQ